MKITITVNGKEIEVSAEARLTLDWFIARALETLGENVPIRIPLARNYVIWFNSPILVDTGYGDTAQSGQVRHIPTLVHRMEFRVDRIVPLTFESNQEHR